MKKLMCVCAPITSRSGYGNHSRDLVRSFLDSDKYEVKIIDVKWGDCPRNALNKDNQLDKQLIDCIMPPQPQMERQPDIYVDIRIPNEFQQIGKFNIGITAGIETTLVSHSWLEGVNKMDLTIVPSEHSKGGFLNTKYDKVQQLPDNKQQKVGEMRLEKPMEVVFEGTDTDIFKKLSVDEIDSDFFDMLNDKVPEKFAFLVVGQWTNGNYGEDRKDIGTTIKIFCESFANKKKQPALILKVNGATYSIMDKEDMKTKIDAIKSMFPTDWKLPNIYLLHGDMSDDEMNYLYNHPKVKCMVSFTHGEGYGRPLQEATMVGLPIIATGWSGQLDFLDKDKAMLLPGELANIPKSAVWKDIIIEQSQWFNVDQSQAYNALNFAFDNEYEIKNKAESLRDINTNKFTYKAMAKLLNDVVEKYTKDMPSQVPLSLPKLKKVSDDIPKLKKVEESVV